MCGVMSPPGGMWTSRIGSPAVNTGSHSLRDRVIGSRRACPSAEIDVPVTDSCCFGESRPPGGGLRIGDDDTFVIIGHSVGGDGADGAEKTGDFGVGGVSGKIIYGHIGALGDNQHMHRRLGIDIVKGKGVVVFVDLGAGNFAPQNFGENIFFVIGHGYPSKRAI